MSLFVYFDFFLSLSRLLIFRRLSLIFFFFFLRRSLIRFLRQSRTRGASPSIGSDLFVMMSAREKSVVIFGKIAQKYR
jgi:hypothetical protein